MGPAQRSRGRVSPSEVGSRRWSSAGRVCGLGQPRRECQRPRRVLGVGPARPERRVADAACRPAPGAPRGCAPARNGAEADHRQARLPAALSPRGAVCRAQLQRRSRSSPCCPPPPRRGRAGHACAAGSLSAFGPQAGRRRSENQNATRHGGEPRGTPGPVVGRGARRDLPHLVGGGRPRGPMGAEPGRPAPRRPTSGPGYGRRRSRVLELSVRRRELTAALNRPRGRAEAPPGRRGAAAAAEEEASAGGWSGSHRWAHGVHLAEELPRPGARLHPGAPHRRPER